MSEVRIIKVREDDDGQRLDRWLKRVAPDLPYVLVQKLLRKGQIRIEGKRAKPDTKISAGQEVRLPPREFEKKKKKGPSAEDEAFIRSLVLYEDEHVIALNKPHGLATQGGTRQEKHIDGMLDALADKEGVKPRLVHRLDKDTSGVLLLARSAKIAKKLGEAFKGRDVKKIYWALCTPAPEVREGTIKAPLAKAGGLNKERMKVDEEDGKMAITDYMVVDQALNDVAFMAFWPRTGRTHQIRVHAELMGCPIIGDPKYKQQVEKEHAHEADVDVQALQLSKRLHLHAQRLVLFHPGRKGILDVSAPLPPDLAKSWKALGFDTKLAHDPFDEERL